MYQTLETNQAIGVLAICVFILSQNPLNYIDFFQSGKQITLPGSSSKCQIVFHPIHIVFGHC